MGSESTAVMGCSLAAAECNARARDRKREFPMPESYAREKSIAKGFAAAVALRERPYSGVEQKADLARFLSEREKERGGEVPPFLRFHEMFSRERRLMMLLLLMGMGRLRGGSSW